MQTPMRHRKGSHAGRAGAAEPRSGRLSSAAALVTDIVLVALVAALIVPPAGSAPWTQVSRSSS